MAIQRKGANTVIVYNHLPRFSDTIQKRLSRAIRKATFDIQGNAQVNAPVRTGNLKNSVTPQILDPFHGRVTVGADYGMYVNNGTAFMPANPFFDRAIEKVAPQLEAAVGQLADGLK